MTVRTSGRVSVVAVAVAALLAACGGGGGGDSAPAASAGSGAVSSTDAVDVFFAAATKHGTLAFSSNLGKGWSEPTKVEYWFDGPKYRLSWFTDQGVVRTHMISPDGHDVYTCQVEKKTCQLSFVQAEFHQMIFNGPPGWAKGEGAPDGDLRAYTFTATKLWQIAGSTQDFYLEDLVVRSDGTRIVETDARTASHQPSADGDLIPSKYVFDKPELGVAVGAATFELPYPATTS